MYTSLLHKPSPRCWKQSNSSRWAYVFVRRLTNYVFDRRWSSASNTLCELHRLQGVLHTILIGEIKEIKDYEQLCTAELAELELWADQDEPAQYTTHRSMLCDSLAQEIVLSSKLLSEALRRLQHLQDFSLTHNNDAWWSRNQILVSCIPSCFQHCST
jgi:hypothetical protein